MYPQGCGGSSPFFGTISFVIYDLQAGATYTATTEWRKAPCPTEKSISPKDSAGPLATGGIAVSFSPRMAASNLTSSSSTDAESDILRAPTTSSCVKARGVSIGGKVGLTTWQSAGTLRPAADDRSRDAACVAKGMVLCVSRLRSGYMAHFLSIPVMIYSCSSIRNPEFGSLLSQLFKSGTFGSVKSLRRDPHSLEPGCWLHGPTFCLSTRPLPE